MKLAYYAWQIRRSLNLPSPLWWWIMVFRYRITGKLVTPKNFKVLTWEELEKLQKPGNTKGDRSI